MMLHFAFVTVLYSAVLRGSSFNYVYTPSCDRRVRRWLIFCRLRATYAPIYGEADRTSACCCSKR